MKILFGFVVTDPEKLNKSQNEHYRAVYCGLCDAIGIQYSLLNRMTLTYDLAFLIIILSSVYQIKYEYAHVRCPVHTGRQHIEYNEITSYAADMNILMMYHKLLDDINDDASVIAYAKAALLRKNAFISSEKHQHKSAIINIYLDKLRKAEEDNILIPDIPASLFGEIMAELFDYGDNDELRTKLKKFGFALGKAIYIIDAAADLKKDLKKKKYNPLIMSSRETSEMLIADCLASVEEAYKQLDCKMDNDIIENILLSGIWTVYLSEKNKGVKKSGKRSL